MLSLVDVPLHVLRHFPEISGLILKTKNQIRLGGGRLLRSILPTTAAKSRDSFDGNEFLSSALSPDRRRPNQSSSFVKKRPYVEALSAKKLSGPKGHWKLVFVTTLIVKLTLKALFGRKIVRSNKNI